MEKPVQFHQQQHQEQHEKQQEQEQEQQLQSREALKCPRCNSSNTKFCYYNNYSLSQPRHFCKACKRYWTRGGTLRNVPVGGGCRKNKRVKKPITTTTPTPQHVLLNTSLLNPQTNPNPNPNLDHHNPIPSSTTSNTTTNHHHNHHHNQNHNPHLNPLFYGLIPQNPNYPRFDSDNTRVSGYDLLQPHMNASGLVFGSSLAANPGHNSNLSFTSYMNSPLYGGGGGGGGGSTSSSTSAPTMASLLASTLNQQQRFMGFATTFDGGSVVKDPNNFQEQNKNDSQIEAVASTDLNSMLWDTEGGGWLDPVNNIGSSVPSLI